MPYLVNLVGYHLTFDAEMTSAADLGQFKHAFYNGDTTLWANHEAENYKPYNPADLSSPYTVANGALTITASPVPLGNLPYTSGMLQTADSFQQNQGYFEIRAATDAARGFWPAFWLLPTSYYPEIDILEQPNNSGYGSFYWTHISAATDDSGGFNNVGVDLSQGYHSYGFMWTATTVQFSFDGHYIGEAHATPASMADLKMYMIANLAVGGPGSWPGQPATGASSAFTIDYIRAYSNDPTAPAALPQAISSPDGADTVPLLAIPMTSVGSGPDTLALQMSGDALRGNPRFTISMDGVQQGGVLTVAALRDAGQVQAFNVLGTFGTSAHSVSVELLNELADAGGDRNLYVAGATINGVAVPHSDLSERSDGAESFGFRGNTLQAVAAPVSIGPASGADTFLLGISEDGYQGDAQFTISVDGVEQGGVLTTAASHADKQSQVFAVVGAFGAGSHAVSVRFLNDAYGGSADADRNLYVDSLSYDGVVMPRATAELLAPTTKSFYVPAQTGAGTPPAPVTVGSGADTVAFNLSEDAFDGDAAFTISMDGVQQGGTFTAVASHAAGQSQAFAVKGAFGAGAHVATISFLNDAYGGSAETDRNLYVDGISYDGLAMPGSVAELLTTASRSFYLPAQQNGDVRLASPVTVGAGADTLLFGLSEDAYLGDALFTVSVDGVQQGGVLTAAASHLVGQSQAFAVKGDFGPGAHIATVNFLNDAYGGSADTDRNLYVDSLRFDDKAVQAQADLLVPGPRSFLVPAQTPTGTPTLSQVTIGSGPDTFLLGLSEDAYFGDAMFTVSVDGVQQGSVLTTGASHAAGQSQAFAVQGSFGAGAHVVSVDFLNDDYGGSADADRNLYVDSLRYDGLALPGAPALLLGSGPLGFMVPSTGSGLPLTLNTLSIALAEDAYDGDAKAQVTLDGMVLGTVTATAPNDNGAPDIFTFTGDYGAGSHVVGVTFLNDAYGGSADADRNLYVKGITYDGAAASSATAALYSPGTVSFTVPDAAPLIVLSGG